LNVKLDILRLSRPLHLLFAALTYCLGAAIADYLGVSFSASAFVLGLSWACLVQVSMNLMAEVFRPSNEPILPDQFGAERVYLRDRLLYISIGLLILAAGCAYLLYLSGRITPAVFLLLALSLVILLAYAVPPFKLLRRGFGELLLAVNLGYLFPSLGFVLQYGQFHRLIPILALPLTLLALVYYLVIDFPVFADDIKYERVTLLTRLGWQRAISFHHALVAAAFFLLAISPMAGVSPALLWPAFLTLPFAVFQILLLRGIGLGARPLWKLLKVTSAALFALTAYLLALSFFLR
jgi:1,4-dihydroxy-2-naphthoate polyprenyltransferase